MTIILLCLSRHLRASTQIQPNSLIFILCFLVAIKITPSGDLLLEENYTLTCNILVASHLCPSVTYQWTKNNNTVTPLETLPNSISFSSLRLSDVGQYACRVTVSLFYLNNIISNTTVMELHNLKLQSKSPLCYRQYENVFLSKILVKCSPSPYLCDTDE